MQYQTVRVFMKFTNKLGFFIQMLSQLILIILLFTKKKKTTFDLVYKKVGKEE